MVRLLGLGDNTVDTYVDAGMQYPGGNAVNVAVMARRQGAATSYLGSLGDDTAGRLVLAALRAEGVDVSRVRIRRGANARALIRHLAGERRFLGSRPGVRGEYRLEDADFAFLGRHDVVHTTVNSDLEGSLAGVRAAARLVSFDFSEKWSEARLGRVLPFVDFAFLSCPGLEEEACEALLRGCLSHGVRLAVATRGAEGAIAAEGEELFRQASVPTEVKDTLGAGDGFIAGLLVTLLGGGSLREALAAGARNAARVCASEGAFGHGMAWDGEGAELAREPALEHGR